MHCCYCLVIILLSFYIRCSFLHRWPEEFFYMLILLDCLGAGHSGLISLLRYVVCIFNTQLKNFFWFQEIFLNIVFPFSLAFSSPYISFSPVYLYVGSALSIINICRFLSNPLYLFHFFFIFKLTSFSTLISLFKTLLIMFNYPCHPYCLAFISKMTLSFISFMVCGLPFS